MPTPAISVSLAHLAGRDLGGIAVGALAVHFASEVGEALMRV